MKREQTFIFTGPTLAPEQALEHLEAVYLPPVKLGDIYRICELYDPRAIGIVDGYFNQVPAVWHKEIQHALALGVSVFGAASMGALRAAELSTLGMIGCGKIYQAYENGIFPPFNDETFEDDDEVAVIHSPAELGYLAASEAMVNIRSSLARAMQQGVIDQATGHALVKLAKCQFYADRNYSRLLEIARQQPLPGSQLELLREWLPDNAVDQKQLDALELLHTLKQHVESAQDVPRPSLPPFQHTSQWQAAIEEIDLGHQVECAALNELRLRGETYSRSLNEALRSGQAQNSAPDNSDPQSLTDFHRSPDNLEQILSHLWSEKWHGTNPDVLGQMQCERLLLDHLARTGQLNALEARAADKLRRLDHLPQIPNSDSLSDLDRLQLCDWYFSSQLGEEIPESLEQYVLELGLRELDSFYDMILSEYVYLDLKS